MSQIAQKIADALNAYTQEDWDNQTTPSLDGHSVETVELDDEEYGHEAGYLVDGNLVVVDYSGGKWVPGDASGRGWE